MNTLFLISGHSGGGKTTIMRKLMDNEVISFTTRAIRKHQNEVDGIDYHFISKETFEDLLKNNGLAEWSEYSTNFYGITKEEIELKLSKGDAFSIVDFNGMNQLKELYPNTVSIFIYTTYEEAVLQMKQRGETQEMIDSRLKTYDVEVANKGFYDFVVRNKNGKLDDVVDIVRKIIEMES